MNHRLMVDKQEGLTEMSREGYSPQPTGIKFAAHIFSYLFHPVFIPVLVVAFMIYIHPYLFAGLSGFDKTRVMIMSVMMYTFFPLVTVLLLRALKFIDSIQLKTQKDRIIPLVACMIWYFWLAYIWWNSYKMSDALAVPTEAFRLAAAVFIASIFALMANIRMKISLHTIAAGVMLTFMILLSLSQNLHFGIYLSVAVLITGIVCTSRFIVSDHTPAEIYGGLAAGALSMLIANQVG